MLKHSKHSADTIWVQKCVEIAMWISTPEVNKLNSAETEKQFSDWFKICHLLRDVPSTRANFVFFEEFQEIVQFPLKIRTQTSCKFIKYIC